MTIGSLLGGTFFFLNRVSRLQICPRKTFSETKPPPQMVPIARSKNWYPEFYSFAKKYFFQPDKVVGCCRLTLFFATWKNFVELFGWIGRAGIFFCCSVSIVKDQGSCELCLFGLYKGGLLSIGIF